MKVWLQQYHLQKSIILYREDILNILVCILYLFFLLYYFLFMCEGNTSIMHEILFSNCSV